MEAINRGTAVVRGNTSCWFFIRSQYFGSLVQPCSIYFGILFGLSMLVRIVRPCSMYVGMFFLVAQYGHLLRCMLVFYSTLVTLVPLVRPCSMYVGILLRLSHVSTASMAVFYVQCSIRSQYISTLSTAMFYVCCHFIPPYNYLDTPIMDMVKTSGCCKQISSESSSNQ